MSSSQPRVAIITGASRGIGAVIAKQLAGEGFAVVINYASSAGEATQLVAQLREDGHEAIAVQADVSSADDVKRLFDEAEAQLGKVDVLINNAGLGGEVDVVDMTDDQWSRVLDVTLNSVFRMTRSFLPAMYERKSGVIVNNASVLGWRAQKGQAHYAAAKAGVMAFTRCSAVEAAEHGVRINAVAPSIAMHAFLAKVTTEDLLAKLSAQEAFGRPAEVWEVANVMLFLASDLSSYMTGEVLSVSSQRA